MFPDARHTLQQFLLPLSVDEFLEKTLIGGFCKITGPRDSPRMGLLGPHPESVLLDALHLAPKLTFHSANPTAPPPSLAAIADAADFRDRIATFHARNYSVRFPELRSLFAPLDHLARNLESFLHQPVSASAFWSRGGMKAPVHNDDHDIIVVQLRGKKRWYVSRAQSQLDNSWERIPSDLPDLTDEETIDLHPGDLLYLPRRTFHRVESDEESLHVSIGFTPLTLRDALIAAVDHLSDLDRQLRTSIGGGPAFQVRGVEFEKLAASVLNGAQRLLAECRNSDFLASALRRRSARTVGSLAPLPAPDPIPEVELDTLLTRTNTAFAHLTGDLKGIDFTYPGGHVYIHRGAQESVLYMVNAPRFRVRDIPGTIGNEVRLSLARKFVEVGFLEVTVR